MFTDRRASSLRTRRRRQPWPRARMFKILSLDGGGIKGVYTAELLRQCEEAFGPVGKHFDMIAGTSTGGIIALGLGRVDERHHGRARWFSRLCGSGRMAWLRAI